MQNKYQSEIDDFIHRFAWARDKRIILYGIGRYTATLVAGVQGFMFAGLMDKDPSNIGKILFDLPVLSQEQAEKQGDIIIINTSETYWDVIYRRIEGIKLPVYFKNGEEAKRKERHDWNNPYKGMSLDKLKEEIDKSDVVSFDFFDTLFMRKVCNPRDVFLILQEKIKDRWKYDNSYIQTRSTAIQNIPVNYTLDQLYDEIQRLTGIPDELKNEIKKKEVETEYRILHPRTTMINSVEHCLRSGKDVYIVSDMYLPKKFYAKLLSDNGLGIAENHILISCELNKDKRSGSIWDYYKEMIGFRSALHIGDDKSADVEIPRKYSIRTYHSLKAWDMLNSSSLQEVSADITSLYASLTMGCVMSRIFNDPFAFKKDTAQVYIDNEEDMGYCVFGPVLLTFLLWLIEEGQKDGIDTYVLMSRDGYFLQKDFQFLCGLLGLELDNRYILISRQLAMTAAIENDDDLIAFMEMPYSGNVTELFEDRLGIKGIKEKPGYEIRDYISEERAEINNRVAEIQSDYKAYLKSQGLNDKCGIVDLGFYGNNQRYLNKTLGINMKGYYFNANLSDKNENARYQTMKACFQKADDPTAEQSELLKRMIYTESFLTAPYGMVASVKENGEFISARPMANQKYFSKKEKINSGVQHFIKEFAEASKNHDIVPDALFVDGYYGCCFDGRISYSDDVKSGFYNDNAMMNRLESMLFY